MEVIMKILNLKKYRYFQGIWLLAVIILLFILIFSPLRILGILFISLMSIYIAVSSYSKLSNSHGNRLRSRTRDKMLKDQNEIP